MVVGGGGFVVGGGAGLAVVLVELAIDVMAIEVDVLDGSSGSGAIEVVGSVAGAPVDPGISVPGNAVVLGDVAGGATARSAVLPPQELAPSKTVTMVATAPAIPRLDPARRTTLDDS